MPDRADTDPSTFWQLREAPIHTFGPEDWEAYYPAMAAWLRHADPEIRSAAAERLATAVFWSEPSGGREEAAAAGVARLRWLLGVIDAASGAHSDVSAAFLSELRWKGDDAPFRDVLLAWLPALHGRHGVRADVVEGTAVLLRSGALRQAGCSEWLALLDHPSDYVRACAARNLGTYGDPEDDGRIDLALLAQVTEREIARPGVLGPFWGAADLAPDDLPFEAVPWMLDIIERRAGREPADLPFNGLDFHLHELAGASAAAVRRLIARGAADTAVLTATEYDHPVEGMRTCLLDLGRHPDPEIADAARQHLARVYDTLHPDADPRRLRRTRDWRPEVTLYVLRQGGDGADGRPWRDVAVLHPAGRTSFTDAEARDLADALVPSALRGAPAPHPAGPEAAAAPLRFSDRETQAYASGVLIEFSGNPDVRRWHRIQIIGRGLQGRWTPFDLMRT